MADPDDASGSGVAPASAASAAHSIASARLSEALGALAAGAAACALVVRPVASGEAEGPGFLLLLASIVGLAAYSAALSCAIGPGWPRGAGRGWALPLVALAAWLAVSPAWAVEKFAAAVSAGTWISHLLLAGTLLLLLRTPGRAAAFARALAATTVVVAAYACFQGAFLLPELQKQVKVDPGILDRFAQEQQQELLARLSGGEVFGTFFNPNSLAGFLALLLPVLVALAARPRLPRGMRVVRALLAFLAVATLAWTKSKGGIGAAAIGLLAWAMMAHRERWIPRWRWAAAGAGLALAGAAIAFFAFDGPGRIASARHNLSSSLGVRLNYWAAAERVFLEKPLTGWGPDNFETPYLRVKDVWSGEASRVHNDYLQVAVDLGAVGAVLFFVVWLVFVVQCVRAPDPAGTGTRGIAEPSLGARRAGGAFGATSAALARRAPDGAILVGACAALVMADLLSGSLRILPEVPVISGIVAAFVWYGAWATLGTKDEEGRAADAACLPAALAAGLIATAAHAMVDFDLSVDGVAQTIWAVAAMLLVMRVAEPDRPARPIGLVGQTVLSLGGAAALIAMASGFLPRLMSADVKREEARTLRLDQALKAMEVACEENPWSTEFATERARLRHARCAAMAAEVKKIPESELAAMVKLADAWVSECTAGTDAAHALNPEAAGIASLQGVSQENHAALYHALAQRLTGHARDRALKLEQNHRGAAEAADARAALEYPTRAEYAWRHARNLESSGDPGKAALWYARALEADRVTDLQRLKLDDASREHAVEALRRMGSAPPR